MNICQDRVVIISGAGAGLGASHAKAFAAEGACVIVNDINEEAARSVVDDIITAGGQAAVNTANITDYQDSHNPVQQAIDLFGDLHVVVNNAGITRDRMFASMSESEWDQIIAVHLKGHFCISSHAVQYWRQQSKANKEVTARIINTTSGAGLQGSIGQSNYAAAKAGIVALTLNQAAELNRYGVTVNAIAPAARTAMTTAVDTLAAYMAKPQDGSFDYFAPENVSPLVVWLGSRASEKVTGRIFEVAGGKISIADGWRTTAGVDKGERWQPAEITTAMDEIIQKSNPAQKPYGT